MTERSIFLALLEIDNPSERLAYLDRACAGDSALRAQVEQLLKAHQEPGRFMERPAAALVAPLDEPLVSEGPGTVIGPYKLLEQIGEGGFGVVFMAEQQQPVRRKVALKVLKPGMDSKQVVARFEAERQALALMDHPHIAHVLDAGTIDTGRPYFVMELIRGIPITAFCDDNRLTPRERLELFLAVCQAVQHAHQKGIIHRDLKPSNVLVTLLDGMPVVKVIDFGIAKALGQERLTDKTLCTGFAQMIGTPLYMSPEQAEMSGQDVDTRTDIYALGVLLYELLTGTTPFDKERLKEASYDEIRRIIREEEPVKPSTRISTLGQAATTVSANRKSEPRRLSQLFRGELDWIVMKALEKDRNRRYDAASSFAADVQSYLDDEPVQACPPSAGYRLRKFARKYRMPVTVAAAFALLLVAGVVASAWQAVRAMGAEAKANTEAERAWAAEQEGRQHLYAAKINLMQQAWDSGQVGRLRTLLAETEEYPDRGFEWYYWQRLGHLELHTLIGHRSGVRAVSWSPDGKFLATGSADNTVKIWEAASGRELLTLKGHTSAILSLSWSPDSKLLATGGYDGTAKVWEAAGGRELFILKGQTGRVWSVSWSPDGKRLATGSDDGTAQVWDAAGNRELLTLKGHTNRVWSVSWSPDGKRLATASWDGTARVWDVADGRKLLTLKEHTAGVLSVSWSPDGKRLATGSVDSMAKVWDAADGRELFPLEGHTNAVTSVTWSPDGTRLATGSGDGTGKVWDASGGRPLRTFKGHTNATYAHSSSGLSALWSLTMSTVHAVCWSPDGTRLATAGEDGTAKVWEAGGGHEQLILQGHKSPVHSATWLPDGKRLATASLDGTAKIWDAADGRELFSFRGSPAGIEMLSASWSPEGTRLATGHSDGKAKIWDTADGKELLTIPGHTHPVRSVSWSPDGKRLATASLDGTVKVWDAGTAQELRNLQGNVNPVVSISWSPDGQRLATLSHDTIVKIWEAASGRELRTLKRQIGMLTSVSWSPDGKWLATGCDDGTATVWEVAGGRELLTIHGHICPVNSVSWSPDGKRLATASADGTAKVWEAAGGRELLTLRGHTRPVSSVSWSPDSRRLATTSPDGTAKVWETAGIDDVREWTRQDRVLEALLDLNDCRDPQVQGFIQSWLVLLPLPYSGENGAPALDQQQLTNEAHLRPRPGERVRVNRREFVWQEYHSPEAIVDFNVVAGHVEESNVAYAVCYVESDRPRDALWLQVGSHRSKVYLNGREIYQYRWNRVLAALDTTGPVTLQQGTNVLVFKVLNDWRSEGCLRFVDLEGNPAVGFQVRLTPE